MKNILRQLVYVSSASRLMATGELAQLVYEAQQRNQELSITGLLLYSKGCFMQVLEGPIENVEAVLVSINRDPRHTGMIVLSDMEKTEREFGNWSMLDHPTTDEELRPLLTQTDSELARSKAMILLRSFS